MSRRRRIFEDLQREITASIDEEIFSIIDRSWNTGRPFISEAVKNKPSNPSNPVIKWSKESLNEMKRNK